MLVSEEKIRLTAMERRQLTGITGVDTSHIKSVDQLNGFIHDQIEKLQCHGPGACLAKRLLLSFLPAETDRALVLSEDEISRDGAA